jgi:predicted transposase YdaD
LTLLGLQPLLSAVIKNFSFADTNSTIAGALAEKKGREEVKIEVAHRLIAKRMTIEETADLAGVDVDLLRDEV